MVSKGSQAAIISAAFSCSILWRQVRVLTLTKNMRLRTNPLFKPYAKYFLRVGNGQESSIIDHFPPKADAEPSVGVDIALYPKIHQVPSLDIPHPRCFLGPGNQLCKPRIHGWLNYYDNKKYNHELS